MQQTSAGLGRHRFASDDRFQPALLCGLFAAPSGFHNSFLSYFKQHSLEATALQELRQWRFSLFCALQLLVSANDMPDG